MSEDAELEPPETEADADGPAVVDVTDEPEGSGWARRYPPLFSITAAFLIALAVLPSSLNLPQTNPTQTLEFAPVPPEDQDDEPPPPEGNFDNLGLGSSQGIESDGGPGPGEGDAPATTLTLPPIPPPVISENPVTKRCVGNPPRQTEDPLSPPCVSFFEGDNFGETYQGVTAEEIRLLIYVDGFVSETGGSQGSEDRPLEEYFDLFEPAEPGEHSMVTAYRVWQKYFNERFQTYGRVVHFYMYFHGSASEPENRRADAADNFTKIKPFAVLTDTTDNEDDYLDGMAKRGVLNFGSFAGRATEFFNKYPKLIWGLQPSIEQQVKQYVTYVCSKVVNKPVAISGNPGENGGDRKLGMIHTTDPGWPGLIRIAAEVKKGVEACGGTIEATATFDRCCYFQDNGARPDYATTQMAQFKQEGITTILWTGGLEGHFGEQAQALAYQPEFILMGDGTIDGNNPVRLAGHSTAFDDKAIMITPAVFEAGLREQRCFQAFREVDPDYPEADLGFHCDPYYNLFQLFTGIQVAGPRLGPTSVDKGFHAIPAVRSTEPSVPACFYLPEDYTCIKDAQAEIWDAQGQAPGDSRPGCWKSFEDGRRYLPGEWPEGNIDAQRTGNEPCNAYSASSLLNPNP